MQASRSDHSSTGPVAREPPRRSARAPGVSSANSLSHAAGSRNPSGSSPSMRHAGHPRHAGRGSHVEWSNGVVPRRLTPAPVAEVTAALERHRADPDGREDLRLLTKHFLACSRTGARQLGRGAGPAVRRRAGGAGRPAHPRHPARRGRARRRHLDRARHRRPRLGRRPLRRPAPRLRGAHRPDAVPPPRVGWPVDAARMGAASSWPDLGHSGTGRPDTTEGGRRHNSTMARVGA